MVRALHGRLTVAEAGDPTHLCARYYAEHGLAVLVHSDYNE